MNELLEVAPPVVLAVALNILGLVLKKSPIANWLIPILLPVTGAVVYPFISMPIHYQVPSPTVLMCVYGFIIGSGSVGLNQLFRQFTGASKTGNTDVIVKKP